jgi:hypothetical protein
VSVVIPVSADWLTLRESADAAARSRPLAQRAASLLDGPIVVHDLGSGTGAMMRWLAPLLPGPQTWVLHDWNAALLEQAAETAPTQAVDVVTHVAPIENLSAQDLTGSSLVVTSALLDVLSAGEVDLVVRACVEAGVPALFALTVTGRVVLDPVDAGDRVFQAAFNDHQRRTVGDRRLLGPDAVDATAARFRAEGWSVRLEDSPWRLGPAHQALTAEWLESWLAAAVEERPALREWAGEYARTRTRQLAGGLLRVEVHHQDLLAWPP